MFQNCSFSNCSEDAVLTCSCSNKPRHYCREHISDHCEDGLKHLITHLTVKVLDYKKKEILAINAKNLSILASAKINIINSADNLISLIYQNSNNLVKKIINLEKELSDFNLKIASNLTIEKEKYLYVKNLKLNEFKAPSSHLHQSIIDYFSINLCAKESQFYEDGDDSHLIFTRFGKAEKLTSINLSNFKTTTINNSPIIPSHTIACRIKKDVYFINGGFVDPTYYRESYIINLKEGSFEKLPNSIPRRSGASVCKRDKVYVFGGFNGKRLEKSESFDLIEKTWKNEQNLPKPSGGNTAGLIGNVIIVSGFNLAKLYAYRKGVYSEVLDLPAEKYKIVCNGWVLTSSYLFQYTKSREKPWISHKLNPVLQDVGLDIFTTFYRKEFIYFIDFFDVVWRINTATKEVSSLKLIDN